MSRSNEAAESASTRDCSATHGSSGKARSTRFIPSCSRAFAAAGSTSLAAGPLIQAGTTPTFSPFTGRAASNANRLGREDRSAGSGPEMAASTSAVSSTERAMGPSLSWLQERVIAPVRGTRPKVGRRPVVPPRMHGSTMLPKVSLPIANGTRPAETAAPEPALDPPDRSSRNQGLLVAHNRTVVQRQSTEQSFATRMAPAARRRAMTVASSFGTRLRNGSAPQVVRTPAESRRSFAP